MPIPISKGFFFFFFAKIDAFRCVCVNNYNCKETIQTFVNNQNDEELINTFSKKKKTLLTISKMNYIVTVCSLLWVVTLPPVFVQGSMLRIDKDRIYSRMTVKISEQVPRQLCKQLIENLEVRFLNNNHF